MPIASWDDVLDDEPPSSARLEDIVRIEPPREVRLKPDTPVASFDDIVSIAPAARPPAPVTPKPALPTGEISLARSPADALRTLKGGDPMLGAEIPIATSPAAGLAGLKLRVQQPRQPVPVVAEDPVTPFVREMRGGVGDTAVGVLDFLGQGLRGTRDISLDAQGHVVAAPTSPDPIAQQLGAGVAHVREAYQQIAAATSPEAAAAATKETLARAAALPLDTVGIPVSEIRQALQEQNYGRATGLLTALAAVLGGTHGAAEISAERGRPTLRDAVRQAIEQPDRLREAPSTPANVEVTPDAVAPAPGTARVEDIATIEPPAVEPADLEGLSPTRQDLVTQTIEEGRRAGVPNNAVAQQLERERTGVASIEDVVRIEPPQEDVHATRTGEQPSDRLEEHRGDADGGPPEAGVDRRGIEQRQAPSLEDTRAGDGAEEAVPASPADASRVTPSNPHEVPAFTDRLRTLAEGREQAVRGGRLEEDMAGAKPSVTETLSMPRPERRADASGALVPSSASRAIAAVSAERQLRPSEIVREISRSLDELPVRVGKFSQKAYGIYKPKAQTIRLAVANDLATLAHELGHHIHESLLTAEIPPKPLRDELVTLGAPTSRSSYTLIQRLQEGQAEFTRRWIMDPADVRNAAPKYAAAFETALATHPELQAVLQRAQRQYIGHLSLDPVERGLSHLDFEGKDASPKTDVVTRLQTQWVDDLYPLKRMEQDLAGHAPVDLTSSGYALARLARGASAKADGFLRHGVRTLDGTFIAPALEPALKPVRKQMREFAGYLAAQRAVELRGRGMETGMSLDEARAIVKKYQSPAFDKARDAVYAYQDGLLHYAVAGNLLSKDQYVAIKQLNRAYVPFQRVIDDVGAAAASGGGAKGIANIGGATKRIKGSGRDIINPLESIVRNTHALVAQVEQNRAMTALVTQAEKITGGGRYLERIPDKQIATSFNLEQLAGAIRKELVDAGVDIPDNLDFDKLVTVFTPTQLRLGEKGIVSVMKEGTRQWYAVNDPALFDAIAGIGATSSDLITNLFMKPARWLRAGATTTLGFVARNPIRDTFEATVNSRYGFRLGFDTLKGLFEYAKRGDDYQAFLNSGAGNAALVGMDRNRLRQELARLGAADKRRLLDSTVLNPINLLQAISEASEHATRLGEFMRGVEQEGRTAEGYARAALAARDVTIDFARGGTASKEINRYTAFFNAGVQGTARIAEVFKHDPRGATFRALGAISIPSLALFALNHEDPDYRELPDWERNTYWHIPIGRGRGHSWARVPKPFTLGQVFGNSWEVALGYLADHHQEDLRRILPDKATAWRQVISLFPTALMPAVEAYTNYDTFRDRAIVNPDDLQLDPALQYNRWTSALAKYVGPKIGVAPAKLDHLIYGYGAGVASGAVQLVDRTAQAVGLSTPKPAGGVGRTPLLGTFMRETPGADAQSLEDFYRLRDELDGAKASVTRYEKTEGNAAARARVEQLKKELGSNAEATVERMRVAAANLKDLREGVNAVFVSRSLDPDEKKELLDRLYEQMVNVARAGLMRPSLPSRFPKPPAPALLQKLRAGVAMLDSRPDDRARSAAPANRPAAQGAAAPAAP